ncbi:MAG TPA: type I glutamate--ammonia ligase [Candidatus Cloacimonadota bacterium]|nr:type I glutamate--ammonia ligase [Candidatus Cloacimonadota bacterium]HQL15442.1 type I glutamate--ammonia ligase [Candidatus Cloacimonadota bacterium]
MDAKQQKREKPKPKVQSVDLRYCGLDGKWYHITFPSNRLNDVLEKGIPFDGSSIPGMKSVESGDMILMPDMETAYVDPFFPVPTLAVICSICDAETRKGTKKDPRSVAIRAFEYLHQTGIADTSLWIPELEFYLLDGAEYMCEEYSAGYILSSTENKMSLPADFDDTDAVSQQDIKGYHMNVPFDRFYEVREQMVCLMEQCGIQVRYHHHEVGPASQQEIETELLKFPAICDQTMMMKDIIRRTALANGLTATFMPKPIYNQAGTGLHFHMMLKKNGRNIFYKKGGYADLSPEALWFIGGILTHGKSLIALTNPSTNSYKRLLPGFEAPVKLFFGLANRSAAIRIPKYANDSSSKRFEFRTGDATCNPYFAMSALLLAGLDGIQKKIDPTKHNFGPFDDNVFAWPEKKKAALTSVPSSLKEALEELEKDHRYLTENGVFNDELIESFIQIKMKEHEAVMNRPHPYEMVLYYNQ